MWLSIQLVWRFFFWYSTYCGGAFAHEVKWKLCKFFIRSFIPNNSSCYQEISGIRVHSGKWLMCCTASMMILQRSLVVLGQIQKLLASWCVEGKEEQGKCVLLQKRQRPLKMWHRTWKTLFFVLVNCLVWIMVCWPLLSTSKYTWKILFFMF